MTQAPAKPKGGVLRRIGVIVLPFVVLIGLVAGYMFSRPLWDAKHFKWVAGDGPALANTSYASNFGVGGKQVEPTIRITCNVGHPNLEMAPIMTSFCLGDCSSGGSVQFHESFRTHPFASGSVYFVTVSDNARFTQDRLSNPASDLSNNKPSPIGVGQDGSWWMPPNSMLATRFDYGSDAKANADVYRQARNYIERMAASQDLELEAEGAARFDTRDLKAKLPAFWAACPAPKDPAPTLAD
ncbi:MAG TPA: hypothetical protein VGL66_05320 [Caulobacteraceae bacterium]|jgi:hypothetical protein